jgi:hypothetical protein
MHPFMFFCGLMVSSSLFSVTDMFFSGVSLRRLSTVHTKSRPHSGQNKTWGFQRVSNADRLPGIRNTCLLQKSCEAVRLHLVQARCCSCLLVKRRFLHFLLCQWMSKDSASVSSFIDTLSGLLSWYFRRRELSPSC